MEQVQFGIVFDTAALAPFELGAQLDVLLCYPTWSPERRQKVAYAICAELIAFTIELEPQRKKELSAAYPQYAKSRARSALTSLPSRREKAFEFGLGFLPLLKKAAIGELPMLNGRQRELSKAEIARFMLPPREEGLEINYESRLHDWLKEMRDFHPIAHLAAAYQYIARERSGANKAAPLDYQDLEIHRAIVSRANGFAGYFRTVPALTTIGDRLIDLEWRE